FEKEFKAGGLIGTHHNPFGMVEQSASAFIANKELEELAQEIRVTLLEKKKEASKRYIYRKNKARRWPLGIIASFRVFIFLLIFVGCKSFLKPKAGRRFSEW